MSGLHSLQQLIGTLTPNEQQLCENYLQAFDSRGEKFESKSLKLFRILRIQKPFKEHELEHLIYGKRNVFAFSRVVLRLKERILLAVLLPANTKRSEKLSEYQKKLSEARIRLSQIDFLLERGMHHIAAYRLAYVCEFAEHFEFYPEHLQALTYLTILTPEQQTQLAKKIRKIRKRWVFESTCYELLLLAAIADPASMQARLSELQDFEDGYNSGRASFLLRETEAQVAVKNGNLEKAISCRYKQLRLIEKLPALQDGEKKPETYFQLVKLSFQAMRLQKVLELIRLTLPLHAGKDEKRRVLLETETVAYILTNKPAPATTAITEALTLQPNGKTYYLKALVLFLYGQYAEALETMENVNWKEADKQNFGTAARIFMQMLVIEQGLKNEDEHIDKKLTRLDKQMPLAVHLSEREQLIVDLMQALIVEQVNFKVVYRKFQGHIERLRLPDGETAWNPERLELVVFSEWFMGKVLNLGYGGGF